MRYGNVSTPLSNGRGGTSVATLPVGRNGAVSWPVSPFAGLMAVATVEDAGTLDDPLVNSIPPTLGGGNIDVDLLTVGSAFLRARRRAGGAVLRG
jgi:acetamidase/formamidase